jgi:hypothetical protein
LNEHFEPFLISTFRPWLFLGPAPTAASSHSLFGTLSSTGIRTSALSIHRQISPVPQTAVTADLDQALNIHLHLPS